MQVKSIWGQKSQKQEGKFIVLSVYLWKSPKLQNQVDFGALEEKN